jgi:hypothetical protein
VLLATDIFENINSLCVVVLVAAVLQNKIKPVLQMQNLDEETTSSCRVLQHPKTDEVEYYATASLF